MRLPPKSVVRTQGSIVTLRYTDVSGHKKVTSGRWGHILSRVAEQVVAGTGKDFEVRRGGSSWHDVRMSYEEAGERLDNRWTRTRFHIAAGVRMRRLNKGLPIYTDDDQGV